MSSEFHRAWQHARALMTAMSGSSATRAAYAADIEAFFAWLEASGAASPLHATKPMVSDYIAYLNAAGCGDSVIRRAVSAIRSFYQFLVDNGHADRNPAKGLSRPAVVQRSLAVVSVEQVVQILDGAHRRARDAKPGSLKAVSFARIAAMLETLYSGGLEVSELCALPGHLDLGSVGLHQVRSAGRYVIINRRAKEAIRVWRDAMKAYGTISDEWLFHSVRDSSRPIARSQMHRDTVEAAELAGVRARFGISPAVLRDSMVVHLLEAGMPVMYLAQMLGYKDMAPMARFIEALLLVDKTAEHVSVNATVPMNTLA